MIFVKTFLIQLITLILRSAWKPFNVDISGDSTTHENGIVEQSLEYIRNNIEKPLHIKDICEHLFISESCFFKSFHNVLNMSPHSLILIYKMKAAEYYMKSTDFCINQISQRLGFSSPFYFSTVFKRIYGMSPRDYKNTIK